MSRTIPAALACLLAACASTPPEPLPAPLEPLESFPVEYLARFATEGLPRIPQGIAEEGEDDGAERAERPRYEVGAQILRLAVEDARGMVATEGAWLHASRVDGAEAAELFAEVIGKRRCELLSTPKITLYDESEGWLATVDQVAYVEGFEMRTGGTPVDVFLADPVVAATQGGLLMQVGVRGLGEGAGVEFDLQLHLAELQQPMPVTTGSLPGTYSEVSMQLPVYVSQAISTTAVLDDGQALLLGPVPWYDEMEALMILVTAGRFVGQREL